MDRVALVCHLAAGGPRALRRLRDARLDSLSQLATLDEPTLARVLDGPPELARRVRLEALDLAARTGEPLRGATHPPRPTSERFPWRIRAAVRAFEPRAAARPVPPAEGDEPARPVDASARGADGPLRESELPGLDRALVEALVREGVRTYGALVELASLRLARRVGIPFPRLLDLRFAARERIARAAKAPDPPASPRPLAPESPWT